MQEYAANILEVFDSATPDQMRSGLEWYSDAYRVAEAIGSRYGYSTEIAAGVLAAVSPLNSWGNNVNLATRILANHGNVYSGYLGKNLDKARRIVNGELPLSVLSGNKVRAFYIGILTAGTTDAACVDRHAWCIAMGIRVGNPPKITDKRYREFSAAYAEAGAARGISGAQMQSITWVVWRNRFWAEGAWDKTTALGA